MDLYREDDRGLEVTAADQAELKLRDVSASAPSSGTLQTLKRHHRRYIGGMRCDWRLETLKRDRRKHVRGHEVWVSGRTLVCLTRIRAQYILLNSLFST